MNRSACPKRFVRPFAPVALAGVLGLALVGCQTTDLADTSAPPRMIAASYGGSHGRQSAAGLRERYRANPNDPAAAIGYARALREDGERLRAVAVLERALPRNPEHPGLLGAYGRALAEVGEYQRAFNVFNRAHTSDHPDWRILSVQGAVLDQMGRHEEAQRYYGTALRVAPNEPSVLSNLGLSYALAKDLVRAETTLRRAAAQSRVDPWVRQNLALVMGLQGRFSEAEGGMPAGLRPDEATAVSLRQMLARQNGWTEASQSDKPQIRAEGS
jgi:Flp pilus assembly protein TadD